MPVIVTNQVRCQGGPGEQVTAFATSGDFTRIISCTYKLWSIRFVALEFTTHLVVVIGSFTPFASFLRTGYLSMRMRNCSLSSQVSLNATELAMSIYHTIDLSMPSIL